MKNIYSLIYILGLTTGAFVSHTAWGQNVPEVIKETVFDINTKKVGAEIPHTMYGIFFEDINYGADGGLYGELLKNRSFEFPQPFMGWKTIGDVELRTGSPFDRCPHYAHLSNRDYKASVLQNEGFFGIGFNKDAEYRLTFYARVPEGGMAELEIHIINTDRDTSSQYASEDKITVSGKEWKKYELKIRSNATIAKGEFRLSLSHAYNNSLDLEHVSLFPAETFKNDENGLRKELAEALESMHPGVFRFPGGCIVEGSRLPLRYQWKNSIGPVENRPLNDNRWQYTFGHRSFPDYFQSYGLGFYEYFRLAEELGAEPLPVLSVGLACQYEGVNEVPLDELQPYIDDVLDLIAFANGDPATNKWAKVRSEMGHDKPFNLKYVAIGNEQWGSTYPEHLKPFIEQVRKQYPDIKIIGSAGPQSEGEEFDFLWPEMKKLKVDLVDEHFYRNEEWFLSLGNRYDKYDRKGPKVFAGEYACHGAENGRNHFQAALCEAAFMTGLERNADVVPMATYAPLFAHVDGWQWRPDAIWFDNLTVAKSCSFIVQSLFSNNKGSHVVPLTMNGKAVAGNEGQKGLFASAVMDDATGELIVKVVNTGEQPQMVNFNLAGFPKGIHNGTVTSLHAADPDAENSVENPLLVTPSTTPFCALDQRAVLPIPAQTFVILRIEK